MTVKSNDPSEVFLEIGKKKVFAISAGWPGWARSGRDEISALEALWQSAPRYVTTLESTGLRFKTPEKISDFTIIGRLEGNATTDFGAPDAQLPNDWDPLDGDELAHSKTILAACWEAFDRAAASAEGKELRKGPRGGGRSLEKIVNHVVEAEEGYLRVLGVTPVLARDETIEMTKKRLREQAFKGLELAASGQIPKVGPRGGKRWPARFYLRRVAWHAVDHAWEIEDRLMA